MALPFTFDGTVGNAIAAESGWSIISNPAATYQAPGHGAAGQAGQYIGTDAGLAVYQTTGSYTHLRLYTRHAPWHSFESDEVMCFAYRFDSDVIGWGFNTYGQVGTLNADSTFTAKTAAGNVDTGWRRWEISLTTNSVCRMYADTVDLHGTEMAANLGSTLDMSGSSNLAVGLRTLKPSGSGTWVGNPSHAAAWTGFVDAIELGVDWIGGLSLPSNAGTVGRLGYRQ